MSDYISEIELGTGEQRIIRDDEAVHPDTFVDNFSRSDVKQYLLDMFYPVGCYYETSDASFDPATVWGGEWSLEASGKVHVSAGTGYTIGATGGATTAPTANHKLTVAEIPAHTHGNKTLSGTIALRRSGTNGTADDGWGSGIVSTVRKATTSLLQPLAAATGSAVKGDVHTINATHEHASVGGSGNHNHGSVSTMQPYIVVNRWHRTA